MILKMFKNFFTSFYLKWETFYYYLTLKHRKSVTKERLTETYYFFLHTGPSGNLHGSETIVTTKLSGLLTLTLLIIRL